MSTGRLFRWAAEDRVVDLVSRPMKQTNRAVTSLEAARSIVDLSQKTTTCVTLTHSLRLQAL
ncbi:hypothetical protein E4U42_002761 [Claviceps africana]|uniref:Uncharacterized protein n=1 Tax=Claviceps africana TaxID=83212 RepID=A0A8K0NJI4_9HYPO|nr:hypothetical protein E4U42_002761 [Claviceps africana]